MDKENKYIIIFLIVTCIFSFIVGFKAGMESERISIKQIIEGKK